MSTFTTDEQIMDSQSQHVVINSTFASGEHVDKQELSKASTCTHVFSKRSTARSACGDKGQTSSLVNMWTKCGKASMRWWWMRQQYPQPASAASRAGRKSAKALLRASSLAMQNWSRVCTKDAITCTLTALLSSPSRFRKGLQPETQDELWFAAPGLLCLCARMKACTVSVIHP